MEVTRDEELLIQLIRREGPFSTFTVQKIATPQYPNGVIDRVKFENSVKITNMMVKPSLVQDIINPKFAKKE